MASALRMPLTVGMRHRSPSVISEAAAAKSPARLPPRAQAMVVPRPELSDKQPELADPHPAFVRSVDAAS
jgi:hypothetical protein